MPTLIDNLTERHNQQVAKQEAARLLKEKQEKQRQKNAKKRLAREVSLAAGNVTNKPKSMLIAVAVSMFGNNFFRDDLNLVHAIRWLLNDW